MAHDVAVLELLILVGMCGFVEDSEDLSSLRCVCWCLGWHFCGEAVAVV